MAKEIYNKNAREKALLEEAYSQVHEEGLLDRFTKTKDAPFKGKTSYHGAPKMERAPKPEKPQEDSDPKVAAYKKFLHDFRLYSVAQDPVRPGDYGLTDEEVKKFKELGVQEDFSPDKPLHPSQRKPHLEDAEDVDHLAAEVKKRTRGWMSKEGPVGQRMTEEQAFKAAIEMIKWDLDNYTIDNIEL